MKYSKTELPAGARVAHPGWLYATRADFAEVFENDFEPLYRLAFLLTANHVDAERCFAAAIEDVFEKSVVLKDWARSWIKRSLIKNAIRIVFPESPMHEDRNLWSETPDSDPEVSALTLLPPIERFVFVMVMLEGYSIRECSVLLNCSVERVRHARIDALQRLPLLHQPFAREKAPQLEMALVVGQTAVPGTG